MIRRFGDPRRHDQKYVFRPGAYAILPRRGDLLLTYQAHPHDEVQLPGGGIDPGESALVALHREVLEETGWKIARPRRLGAFRRYSFMPEYEIWAEKLCHIYVAHPVRQVCAPLEADHEPLWADIHSAIALLYNDGDRHFVAHHTSSGL